jgi:hypothetical protein
MQFTSIFTAVLMAATTVSALPIPDSNPIHLRSLQSNGNNAAIYGPLAGHAVKMARSYIKRY